MTKLEPGTQLARYEFIHPIGKGGMGAVWAARIVDEEALDKIVAVKTVLPEHADNPQYLDMLLDEGRILSAIRHPNVATLLDMGEQDEIFYLVFEWVEGEQLSKLRGVLKKKQVLMPMGLALRVVADVCSGLHSAHEVRDDAGQLQLIVHRDVSPQNIMISSSGEVKLIDFGIAKALDRVADETVAGMIKGKVLYMAPEQVTGGGLDRRVDVWAAGAVLYHLVTGRTPFGTNQPLQLMDCLASRSEPNPLPPDLPPVVANTILRALRPIRKDRYPTAADFQAGIEKAIEQTVGSVTRAQLAAFVNEHVGPQIEARSNAINHTRKRLAERAGAKPASPGPPTPQPAAPQPAAPRAAPPRAPSPQVPAPQVRARQASVPDIPAPQVLAPQAQQASNPRVPTSQGRVQQASNPQAPAPQERARQASTPDVPAPQVPEPQVPEPQVPEPQVPEPQVPEPQVPEPRVSAPDLQPFELPPLDLQSHEMPSLEMPWPDTPASQVPAPEAAGAPDIPPPQVPGITTPEVPDVPAPDGPDVLAPDGPDVPAPDGPDVPAPDGPDVPTPDGPDVPTPDGPDVPADVPDVPDEPAPDDDPAPDGPEVPARPVPEAPATNRTFLIAGGLGAIALLIAAIAVAKLQSSEDPSSGTATVEPETTQPIATAQPEPEPEPQPELIPEPAPDAQADAESDAQADTESDAPVEAKAKPVAAPAASAPAAPTVPKFKPLPPKPPPDASSYDPSGI